MAAAFVRPKYYSTASITRHPIVSNVSFCKCGSTPPSLHSSSVETECLLIACPKVVDGRYHTPCGHFISMASNIQDCLQANCIFSHRHAHPFGENIQLNVTLRATQFNRIFFGLGCNSPTCYRHMAPPVQNPLRISPSKCPNCLRRDREGPDELFPGG